MSLIRKVQFGRILNFQKYISNSAYVIFKSMFSHGNIHAFLMLLLMPPLGLLVTLFQTPGLEYLRELSVSIIVLAGALCHQLIFSAQRITSLKGLMSAAAGLFLLLSIEWVHFLMGRETIEGLTDIRMLLYSSMYGSIIVFFLYSAILGLMSPEDKIRYLKVFVLFMSFYHFCFLLCFSVFFLQLVPSIPRVQIINANSVAYSAVFVLSVIFLFAEKLAFSGRMLFLCSLTSFTVVIAVQSRGAMIASVALLIFSLVRKFKSSNILYAALAFFILLSVSFISVYLNGALREYVFGSDYQILLNRVIELGEAHYSQSGHSGRTVEAIEDEDTISTASRIGSSYIGFLSLLDNVLIGVGQHAAYSISVAGSGIHSLHSLLSTSAGVLGYIGFWTMVISFYAFQCRESISMEEIFIFFLMFGVVLLFINSVPVYYALIVSILFSPHRSQKFTQ